MVYSGQIDWFNADGRGSQPCEIKMEAGKIEIFAPETNSFLEVTYRGTEVESGHYELFEDSYLTESKQPHATLHGFKNSIYLDGYYEDIEETGMWRVTLNPKADVPAKA